MNNNPPLLMGDQPLPHSPEFEQAVLSCFMTWPDEMKLEFNRIRPDDFYIPANRRMFSAIMELERSETPIDIITIANKLDETNQFEDVGGMENIRRVANAVPSMANVESYIQEVQKLGRSRRLIGVCSNIIGDLLSNEVDISQTLSTAESEIIKVANEGTVRKVRYVRDGLPEARESIIGRYNKDPEALGITSGYKPLDEFITGFQPGKTYVIAARPSIGKTTLLLNILSRMSMVEKGAFFSLEMTETECIEKLISLFGSLNPSDVYAETIEIERLNQCIEMAKSRIDKLDLIIDDTSYYFEDLVHRIKLLYVKEGITFAAIDYMQLLRMAKKAESREQMIAIMSADMKKLAKDLGIPIIILAQLNRKAEERAPLISDLRESGAIENDADVVALLHRERSDSAAQLEKVNSGAALETALIVSKNRGGPTGPLELWFFPQYSCFQEPTTGYNDNDIPE